MESAKIIAHLARMLREVALAEELAQDALVAALEQWPLRGVPDNPGAWLMTTARNRAIDQLRHAKLSAAKQALLAQESAPDMPATSPQSAADHDIDDDLLRLIFVACHPLLPMEGRVALTLRLLGGLTCDEIARACFVSEAAIQQRVVRAKRTLAAARVQFEVPDARQRPERLGAVLEVIYLIFNEGYAATSGPDWMRPELCEEALRLGRILAQLVPAEPEAHGLLALMELQDSRRAARMGAGGEPVRLLEQDRARWDHLQVRRGLAALERAQALGSPIGRYELQAAIAACHACAPTAADTDWPRIVALYDALAQVAPSPVVELNRAVAVSMAYGPAVALDLVDGLAVARLRDYPLLPGVRADLLQKLGRLPQAREQYTLAAGLATNPRERRLMQRLAAECAAAVRH